MNNNNNYYEAFALQCQSHSRQEPEINDRVREEIKGRIGSGLGRSFNHSAEPDTDTQYL